MANQTAARAMESMGLALPQCERVVRVCREREIKCVCARTGLSKRYSVAAAEGSASRAARQGHEIVCVCVMNLLSYLARGYTDTIYTYITYIYINSLLTPCVHLD